jgi:hypothetical protein
MEIKFACPFEVAITDKEPTHEARGRMQDRGGARG